MLKMWVQFRAEWEVTGDSPGDCYIKADEIKQQIEDIGGTYVKRIATQIEPDGPEDDPRDE